MGAGAKMGELKRAAQQLGVTSTTLREHGWKTASAGRIEAVKNNPPGWLIEARERRRQKRACSAQRKAVLSVSSRSRRREITRLDKPGHLKLCTRLSRRCKGRCPT